MLIFKTEKRGMRKNDTIHSQENHIERLWTRFRKTKKMGKIEKQNPWEADGEAAEEKHKT